MESPFNVRYLEFEELCDILDEQQPTFDKDIQNFNLKTVHLENKPSLIVHTSEGNLLINLA